MNEKDFFKKKKKINDDISGQPQKITEDLDGLISYYTAPNIRNKIKHPFFLAIRFNKCASLFYNKNVFNNDNV